VISEKARLMPCCSKYSSAARLSRRLSVRLAPEVPFSSLTGGSRRGLPAGAIPARRGGGAPTHVVGLNPQRKFLLQFVLQTRVFFLVCEAVIAASLCRGRSTVPCVRCLPARCGFATRQHALGCVPLREMPARALARNTTACARLETNVPRDALFAASLCRGRSTVCLA